MRSAARSARSPATEAARAAAAPGQALASAAHAAARSPHGAAALGDSATTRAYARRAANAAAAERLITSAPCRVADPEASSSLPFPPLPPSSMPLSPRGSRALAAVRWASPSNLSAARLGASLPAAAYMAAAAARPAAAAACPGAPPLAARTAHASSAYGYRRGTTPTTQETRLWCARPNVIQSRQRYVDRCRV